jgi:hypothetical protein
VAESEPHNRQDRTRGVLVGESGEPHPCGLPLDAPCPQCWSNRQDAGPPRCRTCGGRVHNEFGDEKRDGSYWLYFLCEVCGSTCEDTRWS